MSDENSIVLIMVVAFLAIGAISTLRELKMASQRTEILAMLLIPQAWLATTLVFIYWGDAKEALLAVVVGAGGVAILELYAMTILGRVDHGHPLGAFRVLLKRDSEEMPARR